MVKVVGGGLEFGRNICENKPRLLAGGEQSWLKRQIRYEKAVLG